MWEGGGGAASDWFGADGDFLGFESGGLGDDGDGSVFSGGSDVDSTASAGHWEGVFADEGAGSGEGEMDGLHGKGEDIAVAVGDSE